MILLLRSCVAVFLLVMAGIILLANRHMHNTKPLPEKAVLKPASPHITYESGK